MNSREVAITFLKSLDNNSMIVFLREYIDRSPNDYLNEITSVIENICNRIELRIT